MIDVYPDTPKGAVIDGEFRYALHRRWDTPVDLFDYGKPRPPPAVFCLLNPSTADGTEDDNTVSVCTGYAKRWGCGGLLIVNPQAYRATNPDDLIARAKRGEDIVGPRNWEALEAAFYIAANAKYGLVAAWGATPVPGFAERIAAIVTYAKTVPFQITALAVTKDGHPHHTRGLSSLLIPQAWSPP